VVRLLLLGYFKGLSIAFFQMRTSKDERQVTSAGTCSVAQTTSFCLYLGLHAGMYQGFHRTMPILLGGAGESGVTLVPNALFNLFPSLSMWFDLFCHSDRLFKSFSNSFRDRPSIDLIAIQSIRLLAGQSDHDLKVTRHLILQMTLVRVAQSDCN
jgi:hypothetical protein